MKLLYAILATSISVNMILLLVYIGLNDKMFDNTDYYKIYFKDGSITDGGLVLVFSKICRVFDAIRLSILCFTMTYLCAFSVKTGVNFLKALLSLDRSTTPAGPSQRRSDTARSD